MSTELRLSTLIFALLPCLSACTTPPLRIQSDVVPPGSLRVAQITYIGKREELLKDNTQAYKSIIGSGVADSDLVDGSVVMARIYCCGGITMELSSEYVNRIMLYVPKNLSVALGDYVEVRVGRPPEHGDTGRINTVTRIVAKYGDKSESCWWDPKDDRLWLRVIFCEWMPQEGWIKQGGNDPAWFKPAP